MTAPYSVDLRERALARKAAGETHRQIAAALQISPSCVSIRGDRRVASAAGSGGTVHAAGPDAELAARGVKTQPRAVWVFVHDEDLSFKKTLLPEEQARPDVARRRARWRAHQGRIEASRLVFIDETWIKANMAPLRGWGPRGRRLRAYAPHGHWKTLTFIAALRCEGIDAPLVFDGPINGEAFQLYVERILAPALRPGDVVIMDNLGSHKGKAARAAIRARKAHLIFLPPYSPDLNPIEQVFAKLKHLMRKAQPREIEATWRKAGQLLDLFSPQECANYFVNAGYGSV
jgi:transposase